MRGSNNTALCYSAPKLDYIKGKKTLTIIQNYIADPSPSKVLISLSLSLAELSIFPIISPCYSIVPQLRAHTLFLFSKEPAVLYQLMTLGSCCPTSPHSLQKTIILLVNLSLSMASQDGQKARRVTGFLCTKHIMPLNNSQNTYDKLTGRRHSEDLCLTKERYLLQNTQSLWT